MYIPRAGVEPTSSGLQPPVITVILPRVKNSRKIEYLSLLELINWVLLGNVISNNL